MANKIDYNKELEKEIGKWSEIGECPAILLHCCCAPCASYCMEYLSKSSRITAYYYNPNITDEDEYSHRIFELKRLVESMPMRNEAKILEGEYEPEAFIKIAEGLENEPERGKRCVKCFYLRLERTAMEALKGGYDYFATTLTLSPLKDASVLNRIGMSLSEKYGVNYLPSDFKKKGGYIRSIELSGQYGLYRQDYCGCEYSRAERNMRREGKWIKPSG